MGEFVRLINIMFILSALVLISACGGGGTEDAAIATQPAVSPPVIVSEYSVSGDVSGLVASRVVIQSNLADEITIATDGSFVFPTDFENGTNYQVLITTQPDAQTCSISNANGQVANRNVTDVAINCVRNTPPKPPPVESEYSISGSLSGLVASRVVVQSNLADEIIMEADGEFVFPTDFENGTNYQVLITNQPDAQTCSISNANGQVANQNVTDVAINCVHNTSPPPIVERNYSLSGSVAGLVDSRVVIKSNLDDEIIIEADGEFVFPLTFETGTNYQVLIITQPDAQTCSISNATGQVADEDVTNVAIICEANPPPIVERNYSLSGSVAGLVDSRVVIKSNRDDEIIIEADGDFVFPTDFENGTNYQVLITNQPDAQTCSISNATGQVDDEDVTDINVICEDNAPSPPPEDSVQLLFDEDIAEIIVQSTPSQINLPLGLQAAFDMEYVGSFRVAGSGDSNSNYAVGALGHNSQNNSLYMAGHSHHNAIAEFEIPADLSFEENVENITIASVFQNYITILDKKDDGNDTNKITGILSYKDNLLVTSEIWYDAGGTNIDNLQVFSTANSLSTSAYKGMLQIDGGALAAGYMSKIPEDLVDSLDAEYLVGWASNYSITSRYSQGPSIHRFNPQNAVNSVMTIDKRISATSLMVFPLEEGKELVQGGADYKLEISPIWGPVSKAKYGFFIPGTGLFLAVGSSGGINSGIGYKITQDNGTRCPGQCSYEADDNYNFFWLFDVNDLLSAEEPWLVQPVSYGKWSHPYDDGGVHRVLGATYNETTSILYITLGRAGRVGEYDRPPLIVAYRIESNE